jgi:hypothetical protein
VGAKSGREVRSAIGGGAKRSEKPVVQRFQEVLIMLDHLDDAAVEQKLMQLAHAERVIGADIISHLVEVQQRKLYAKAGYESLFMYCRIKLGFSRSTAYRRKAVVEKAVVFPEMIERLRDGRLQLCAAAAITTFLDVETAGELLEAVVGMSHADVETYLTKTWRPKSAAAKVVVTPCSNVETLKLGQPADVVETKTPEPAKRTVIKPLTETACRVSVTLNDKTLASLKRAKEILGNKSDDDILSQALDLLLAKIAPERRHARREGTKVNARSRRGSQSTRDQVMTAGNCQCAYVAADGTRCRARTFLEIDHIKPWGLGGISTPENLRPMCRTHNQLLARQAFGAH